MTVEQLRKEHGRRPFRPLLIRTADGQEFTVPHPEFLYIPPHGRTVFVSDSDGTVDIIDVLLVASIHVKNGRRSGKRKGSNGG